MLYASSQTLSSSTLEKKPAHRHRCLSYELSRHRRRRHELYTPSRRPSSQGAPVRPKDGRVVRGSKDPHHRIGLRCSPRNQAFQILQRRPESGTPRKKTRWTILHERIRGARKQIRRRSERRRHGSLREEMLRLWTHTPRNSSVDRSEPGRNHGRWHNGRDQMSSEEEDHPRRDSAPLLSASSGSDGGVRSRTDRFRPIYATVSDQGGTFLGHNLDRSRPRMVRSGETDSQIFLR